MRNNGRVHGVVRRHRRIGGVLVALGTLVIGASAITAAAPVASSAPMHGRSGSALGPVLSQERANSNAPLPAMSRYRVAAYEGVKTQGVAGLQIPSWTHTQEYPAGNEFSYTMVGNDPFTTQANPSTTIQSPVIGLKFVFSDGTSTDASTPDPSCSPSQSPVAATLGSPIFQTAPSVGTQFVDAYQRANFDPETSASGTNPNYHVLLQGSQAPAVTLTVPADKGRRVSTSCKGTATGEGLVDVAWLQSQVESTLAVMTGATGQFPVFVLYNTVGCLDPSNGNTCGILGMHGATTSSPVQTYAFADYQLAGSNPTDVEPFAHEVAEWMSDPLGDNLAPTWGYIGQFKAGSGIAGCSPLLEVADPLTGDLHAVSIGAATYHVPDLAFASWFFRQSPSPTPNGKYSYFGGLTSPSDATVCPAQPVSVTANPGDGQATVSWKEPSGASSTVDQYAVCYTADISAGPLNCAETGTFVAQEIDSPSTSTVVTGLNNGTTYAFSVYAAHLLPSGEFDVSTPSFFSNSVTPVAAPVSTSPPAAAPVNPNPVAKSVPSQNLTTAAASPPATPSQLAFTGKNSSMIMMGGLLVLLGAIVSWRWRRQPAVVLLGRDDILPAQTWYRRAGSNWRLPGNMTRDD